MDIFPEAFEHFKRLLMFDTTNPPGNEKECVQYIAEVLAKEGLRPQIIDSADRRANLVVGLAGDGSAKPLLIHSHVDVVTAEKDKWTHPPFDATVADGCVWGRGAIDMKNMTAYCLATIVALAREKSKLKRDLVMSVVSDEETGGDYGMGFLTDKLPDMMKTEYALGELGGYTVHMNGKRVYPVQVGEKGIYWIKIRFNGKPGHGSIPAADNVHFEVASFLSKLLNGSLPQHLTASTSAFLDRLARHFGPVGGLSFKLLKTPLGPRLLRNRAKSAADPDQIWAVAAMLTNTANPTGLESGRQHNVVPSTAALKLDCRLLPGFTGQDLVRELERLTGQKFSVEVVREAHGYECPIDTPLFAEIEKQIEAADPGGVVVPNLATGFTDAQYLRKKFGTICYGFTPVKMPEGMSLPKLYHGHNERIPVDGFRWGLDVFQKTVKEFCMRGG